MLWPLAQGEAPGCVFQKGMTHPADSCEELGRSVLVRKNGNSVGPHPLLVTTGVCQGWHGCDRGRGLQGGQALTNEA